jgi:drug/metabolite transporter (DMT)-like permease
MWFALSILSAFLYASLWLFARASKGLPTSVVTAFQFVPGPIMLILLSTKIHFPWTEPRWYLFLITALVIVPPFSWALNFASQRIEVTLIKPLSALSSISAVLFGMILAHQTFSLNAILGILISTAGLMLIYHARWTVWKKPYPWIALASVLVFGFNATVAGYLFQVFPHPLTVSAVALTGGFIPPMLASMRHHKRMTWNRKTITLLLSFAAATIAQELTTDYALVLAPAAYVLSVKRTSIIMASAAGYFFFHEKDIPLKKLILATVIVVTGLAILLI